MADDKNKNQGQQGGMGEGQQGGSHQAPGRNPQGDQSTQDKDRQGGETAALTKRAARTNRPDVNSGAVHTRAHV